MNERIIQRAAYSKYMLFPNPEKSPWNEDFLNQHLVKLGARKPLVTDSVIGGIKNCYAQKPNFRFYHRPDHAAFVGTPHVPDVLGNQLSPFIQEQAKSALVIAGLFHDAAYKHVDALDNTDKRAWSTALETFIEGMAEYRMTTEGSKQIFKTYLTPSGKTDAVTEMVANMFAVQDEGIPHNQGGNEFDSALAAAKFLEKQSVPPQMIVAVTAMIAATIPFRKSVGRDEQNNIIDDGYIGELAQRVRSTSLTLNNETYQPDWNQVNDIMRLAVHIANRDISTFMLKDNAPDIIQGGRNIKKEEVRSLRIGVTTMGELVQTASIQASAPLLYGWVGSDDAAKTKDVPVPAENVPNLYLLRDNEGQIMTDSYPPQTIYETAVLNTKKNCDLTSLYFESHQLGISVAAAIATLVGESDAPVPGFVDSNQWHDKAVPQNGKFGELSYGEKTIYYELMEGIHQIDVDSATSQRSPISAVLLGVLGSEEIRKLSAHVQKIHEEHKGNTNPFAEKAVAEKFMKKVKKLVGEENVRTIVTELHRVAIHFQDDPKKGNPNRAEKLKNFVGEINIYEAA